ncbi:MAG: FeS assembly SUF system protein [Flavobacteriales bacterium]|jgi:FeS assembly SUF system protein|nr:FeS assembly SUF system protein [Flavobacteriales bacterium]|tara:strand:+ start:493 stop:810 length:318 start_codon:yes stop_codon:yes gene_type:complete
MSENLQKLGEDVVKVLCEIYDPEIPVNIYELGLIYDVQISENFEVKILMTFTAPNCPVAETMPVEIKEKVEKIPTINKATIDITWDPPWQKDMMSEEAKLELGFL